MYPVDIYLLKLNNENSRTSCVICSKLTKKRHMNSLMRTFRNIDVSLVLLLLTLKRFHTFS